MTAVTFVTTVFVCSVEYRRIKETCFELREKSCGRITLRVRGVARFPIRKHLLDPTLYKLTGVRAFQAAAK